MGKAKRQVSAEEGCKEGRTTSQESSCSEADESSSEEEAFFACKSALGCCETIWQYVFIEP